MPLRSAILLTLRGRLLPILASGAHHTSPYHIGCRCSAGQQAWTGWRGNVETNPCYVGDRRATPPILISDTLATSSTTSLSTTPAGPAAAPSSTEPARPPISLEQAVLALNRGAPCGKEKCSFKPTVGNQAIFYMPCIHKPSLNAGQLVVDHVQCHHWSISRQLWCWKQQNYQDDLVRNVRAGALFWY
jgi:hypothetical protein